MDTIVQSIPTAMVIASTPDLVTHPHRATHSLTLTLIREDAAMETDNIAHRGACRQQLSDASW